MGHIVAVLSSDDLDTVALGSMGYKLVENLPILVWFNLVRRGPNVGRHRRHQEAVERVR